MTNVTKSRPLSPHLQVYKPIPTMVMSIVHRITGGALYFGTLIGRLVLFGYTWALVQHMLGGLRHFMWDMGHGYEKEFSTKLAIATPFASVALTILIWIVGYVAR